MKARRNLIKSAKESSPVEHVSQIWCETMQVPGLWRANFRAKDAKGARARKVENMHRRKRSEIRSET